jgi:Flp pilus assembly protein TadD
MVLAGQAAAGLGRIDRALAESTQDPNERLWLRFAGIARLELGDDQQAIGALQQAAALGPPAPPLRAALASAYALRGERAQSREQFELLKQAADPVALQQLLDAAEAHQGSRYWQGLHLAAADAR